ncbi:MBL fold metallo-hydrolase, partial [Microbacterium gubbeenense]
MRITKHDHAYLTLEKRGETLVIDPGVFAADVSDLSDVVGVVITHEHADHWTPDHLQAIAA